MRAVILALVLGGCAASQPQSHNTVDICTEMPPAPITEYDVLTMSHGMLNWTGRVYDLCGWW